MRSVSVCIFVERHLKEAWASSEKEYINEEKKNHDGILNKKNNEKRNNEAE